MANADLVRKALMQLLGAKQANKGSGFPGITAGDDATPKLNNEQFNLNQSRVNADVVQGDDALALKQPGQNLGIDPGQQGSPTFINEGDIPGIRQAENLAEDSTNGGGQFGPEDALLSEFVIVTGRSPTIKESRDPALMQKIIESVTGKKFGENTVKQINEDNPFSIDDEIPF